MHLPLVNPVGNDQGRAENQGALYTIRIHEFDAELVNRSSSLPASWLVEKPKPWQLRVLGYGLNVSELVSPRLLFKVH
jgi:CMP-2-keto-3-deoxyoctulosonic acid synthetase